MNQLLNKDMKAIIKYDHKRRRRVLNLSSLHRDKTTNVKGNDE